MFEAKSEFRIELNSLGDITRVDEGGKCITEDKVLSIDECKKLVRKDSDFMTWGEFQVKYAEKNPACDAQKTVSNTQRLKSTNKKGSSSKPVK